MKRLVALATVAVFALVSTLTATAAPEDNNTHNSTRPPTPPSCTAKTFRAFSAKVWDREQWDRGKPKPTTIRAQRRRLACAGPGNRIAMQRTWRRDKDHFYRHRHFCLSGPVFAGRISTFSGGLTAGGYQATEPGIALRSTSTLGETFRLRTESGTDYVLQTDYGPATWTGRVIDITEAEAARIGGVVTDSWGEAKLIPPGCL